MDARLLDCMSRQQIESDFDRVLALMDALQARIAALETPEQ